jgi:3-deoxy-D-manno-octulosonic-acid transferase
VERARIHTVGSIKFDPTGDAPAPGIPRAVLEQIGVKAERRILLAGSTHDGEEAIVARAFQRLRAEFRDLFLILAPRHVERAREIEAQLRGLGLTTICRSAAATSGDVLLLDTTGELRDWYSVATIVFIGKSLTAHGGQNPVEAIVADRPVLFGPHMENFARLAEQLVASRGALQPNDEATLTKEAALLLRGPATCTELVRNARKVLDRHRGATERTAGLLRTLITSET